MTLEENLKAIESVIDYVKGCGPAAEQAIEAIREMQAELAGRDADTVEKPEPGEWTEARENDAERWLLCWPHHEGGCKCAICISEGYLKDAMKEIKRLKEELHTLKTSWEFQGGERIIAERDKLLKRNNALFDDLDAARNDERRVSGERDSLRDKLRATEESMGKAEGEVKRLREYTRHLPDCPRWGRRIDDVLARPLSECTCGLECQAERNTQNVDTFCAGCGAEWDGSIQHHHKCS